MVTTEEALFCGAPGDCGGCATSIKEKSCKATAATIETRVIGRFPSVIKFGSLAAIRVLVRGEIVNRNQNRVVSQFALTDISAGLNARSTFPDDGGNGAGALAWTHDHRVDDLPGELLCVRGWPPAGHEDRPAGDGCDWRGADVALLHDADRGQPAPCRFFPVGVASGDRASPASTPSARRHLHQRHLVGVSGE